MGYVSPLRCAVCERPRPKACGGFCACGAAVWEPVPHEPPPGIAVESLDGKGTPLRPTHFPALLSQALGGVVLGLKVLVGGAPGAGKSTLCAELAAQIAERRDGIGYWLDAEQNKDLVRELFPRTSSSPARIRLVSRRGTKGMKVGWREALQAVPPDAAVIVVDSLQRWARLRLLPFIGRADGEESEPLREERVVHGLRLGGLGVAVSWQAREGAQKIGERAERIVLDAVGRAHPRPRLALALEALAELDLEGLLGGRERVAIVGDGCGERIFRSVDQEFRDKNVASSSLNASGRWSGTK